MRKPRARERITYEEWRHRWARREASNNNRLKYYKTDCKHWPLDKGPNNLVRNKPLWKVYNKVPIRITEYRYLVNYFKYKGLTFSYPIEKIKFINEQSRCHTSEIPTNS